MHELLVSRRTFISSYQAHTLDSFDDVAWFAFSSFSAHKRPRGSGENPSSKHATHFFTRNEGTGKKTVTWLLPRGIPLDSTRKGAGLPLFMRISSCTRALWVKWVA